MCRAVCVYITGQSSPECKIANVGVYFWTAGQWEDPTKKSKFVWKVKTRNSKDYKTYPMTYTHWHKQEANNVHGPEACVALWPWGKDYGWNDARCHFKCCFVCEISPTPTKTSSHCHGKVTCCSTVLMAGRRPKVDRAGRVH